MLKQRIDDDMKAAMKAQDAPKRNAIQLIRAAIKQREVDERIEMTDDKVLEVLNKAAKQRRDSISQYQTAGRQDLVDQEVYELNIIQSYLPAQLGDAEIEAFIKAAITATGAASAKEMGKVMAELKPKLQGRADIAVVSAKVKAQLGG